MILEETRLCRVSDLEEDAKHKRLPPWERVSPEREKVNAGSPPFRRAGREAALGHEGRLNEEQPFRV